MRFESEKVAVMGGSSGVGLATARALAAGGAEVVITGRDRGKLERAAAGIPEGAAARAVDASSREALKAFCAEAGPFDHLVLSLSGGEGGGPFRSLDLGSLRRAFEAKFWAHVQAVQACLDALRPDGSVTFVTAASARTPLPGTAGLAAVNGALEAMVPTLALELQPLRVNAVSPGVIRTPWWDRLPADQREAVFAQSAAAAPVGRIGRPEDVADAILFLIRNTFVTGTVLECDGGIRIR